MILVPKQFKWPSALFAAKPTEAITLILRVLIWRGIESGTASPSPPSKQLYLYSLLVKDMLHRCRGPMSGEPHLTLALLLQGE